MFQLKTHSHLCARKEFIIYVQRLNLWPHSFYKLKVQEVFVMVLINSTTNVFYRQNGLSPQHLKQLFVFVGCWFIEL